MPEGIEGPDYRFVDLDGEGLSGLLSEVGGAWVYKRNTSASNLVVQSDGSYAARGLIRSGTSPLSLRERRWMRANA
jgi:hypothetical protein